MSEKDEVLATTFADIIKRSYSFGELVEKVRKEREELISKGHEILLRVSGAGSFKELDVLAVETVNWLTNIGYVVDKETTLLETIQRRIETTKKEETTTATEKVEEAKVVPETRTLVQLPKLSGLEIFRYSTPDKVARLFPILISAFLKVYNQRKAKALLFGVEDILLEDAKNEAFVKTITLTNFLLRYELGLWEKDSRSVMPQLEAGFFSSLGKIFEIAKSAEEQ
ncbi:MAG: hypothetical protein ACPLZG_10985 [Thermoproteota archaeon]